MDRENLFSDRSISKAVLRNTLRELGAQEFGIVRSGGGRTGRLGVRCAIAFLFRKPCQLPKNGERNLHVGGRELVVEFQPGSMPPTFLKARIIPGDKVDLCIRRAMERAFLEVKNRGGFESSYVEALRDIVRLFVEYVKQEE